MRLPKPLEQLFDLGKKLEPVVYPLLRILIGVLFSLHGFAKIFSIEALLPYGPPKTTQEMVGGVIEILGGLSIAAGFLTRLAAFLCCGQMAVAYIQVHWKLKFDETFFPIANYGEDALLYCFWFLLIFLKGPGALSVDEKLGIERDA